MPRGKIDGQSTLDKLLGLLDPLIGKPCTGFSRGYPQTYTIDIGELRDFSGSQFGTCWISTASSEFILQTPGKPPLIDTREIDLDDDDQMERVAFLFSDLIGLSITGMQVNADSLALSVEFGGQRTLTILPDDDPELATYAIWEVTFPDNIILEVANNRNYWHGDRRLLDKPDSG